MSAPFVAEVRIFACNFAPKGWSFCNGQILPLSQNTALFSLVGTYYGGDGKSTFALPDLQGRTPVSSGQSSASGTNYFIGETGGNSSISLLTTEMPVHTHALAASQADATDRLPPNNLPAGGMGGIQAYAAAGSQVPMAANAASVWGGTQPHNNMQPYLTLNFCIALQGIFPARN